MNFIIKHDMRYIICGMVLRCVGTLTPGLSLDSYSRSDNHCCT